MSEKIFKLGVIKLGCIGAAPLLDLLLDERADRKDLETRAFTTGAKLDPESCQSVTQDLIAYQPDLTLLVSPNAALPGPTETRNALAAAGLTTITLGDGPSRKTFFKKNEEGKQEIKVLDKQGFLIFPADPMLGARREFLDPTEMALFNADVIKLISATGVLHFVQNALDGAINAMKSGSAADLPKQVVSAEDAISAAQFANPYAAAKAYAALKVAEAIPAITGKACFVEQDPAHYIPMVAAAHEMMRSAALLADQAREIEKYNDSVLRTPHASEGKTRRKVELMAKPT